MRRLRARPRAAPSPATRCASAAVARCRADRILAPRLPLRAMRNRRPVVRKTSLPGFETAARAPGEPRRPVVRRRAAAAAVARVRARRRHGLCPSGRGRSARRRLRAGPRSRGARRPLMPLPRCPLRKRTRAPAVRETVQERRGANPARLGARPARLSVPWGPLGGAGCPEIAARERRRPLEPGVHARPPGRGRRPASPQRHATRAWLRAEEHDRADPRTDRESPALEPVRNRGIRRRDRHRQDEREDRAGRSGGEVAVDHAREESGEAHDRHRTGTEPRIARAECPKRDERGAGAGQSEVRHEPRARTPSELDEHEHRERTERSEDRCLRLLDDVVREREDRRDHDRRARGALQRGQIQHGSR